MPGTEVVDTERAHVVNALTVTGWLVLGGWIGLLLFQLERARLVDTASQFAGVWDQRIEVLSFVMLPPNLVVLAPAAAAAVAARWMSSGEPEVWLTTLLRLIIGLAIVMFAIGAISIVNIVVNDDGGPSQFDIVSLRLGGMSMAAGYAWMCVVANLSRGA